MDLVDLDKVLDEFEEEEKAALCIVPGQELKPSGYVEFLHKHQEQEWTSLNSTDFASTSGYTLERKSVREPVNISYDDPYEGFTQSKLGFIQDPQLDSFKGYDSFSGKVGRKNQSELVTSLTPHSNADGLKTVLKRSTSEHKGTIACQNTEVQTDDLSPDSEKELMSSPFPRSDILVEGHRDTMLNSDRTRSSVTEADRNSSPIYASVDSDCITFTTTQSASENNVSSSFRGQFSPMNLENVDISSQTPQSNQDNITNLPSENSFSASNQPVGFNDNPMDGDLDESAIDMYLNNFDAEGIVQTSPSVEEKQYMSACDNSENDNIRSLADEFKEAQPGVTDSELNQPNPVLERKAAVTDGQLDHKENDAVTSSQQDMVNKQVVFNSLISGKMEIETILDDLKEGSQPSRTDIGSSLLKGRSEIEGILDEVVRNQQKMSKEEAIVHFVNQHAPSGVSNLPQMDGTEWNGNSQGQRQSPGQNGEHAVSPTESLTISDSASQNHIREGEIVNDVETRNSSMNLGIGARPKDPSMIKKNRPNSLLGLSKVSLDSSTQVVKQMDGTSPDLANDNPNRIAIQGSGSFQNGDIPEQPDPAAIDGPRAAVSPSTPEDFDETSPESMDGDAGHKMKRPTTLNLPSRPDFGSSHENNVDQQSSEDYPENPSGQMQEITQDSSLSVGLEPQQVGEGAASAPSAAVIQSNIGNVAPFWIPDADAPSCMMCQAKFTMWKRRHHCRACGKVLCATCCSQKAFLAYMENKEARVCVECFDHLNAAQGPGATLHSPNPNNPNEYCSKVPPSQQAKGSGPVNPPVVMVPTGVLKTSGSQRRSGEPKQVMFSDGIRPGGDLTELDGSDQPRAQRRGARASKRSPQHQAGPSGRKSKDDSLLRSPSLIPEGALPPLYIPQGETGYVETDEALNQLDYTADYKAEPGICYAVNKNMSVNVRVLNLDCCVNRVCWSYVTKGMVTAGQCELVVLLELKEDEAASDAVLIPPCDVFVHLQHMYEEAMKGQKVQNMSHATLPPQQQEFLGSREYGGFLYMRASFQCLSKLNLCPEGQPYLFGLLLQRWEAPWAKLFPIRLMLRLGAEYRYYPCPLVSVRERKSVFFEIGHTIINLLADFRNFQYSMTQIKGVTIHMENKRTVISFPRNRYEDVMRVSRNSNEHVMALGSSFSLEADSHLVCIQNEDGSYQTQAINIQNKPRLVTGASFVVFNGALKTSAGLHAKLSIVEDGLMIQVLPEALSALKESLKTMSDHVIQCGPTDAAEAEEVVELKWTDDDRHFNMGAKSFIDHKSLEGVESLSVQCPQDVSGPTHAIRWTQVYFLQQDPSHGHSDPQDLSRLTEEVAQACCLGLVKHLDELYAGGMVRLGLRVKLTRDSVGFEVGSKGQSLPAAMMNSLDSYLIPIIHQASEEEGLVTELIFHIVE